jgi:hypothetical protein
MSIQIDFSLIPANIPSLCIPRVFLNITREQIALAINSIHLGKISRIDLVKSKEGKSNRVFIHFEEWGNSPDVLEARQDVLCGGNFKIMYDNPYFWIVSASKCVSSPVAVEPKQQPMQKQHIPIEAIKIAEDFEQNFKQQEQKQKQPIDHHKPVTAKEMIESIEQRETVVETKIFGGFNTITGTWHCTSCGEDMGKQNPRQYCGKSRCHQEEENQYKTINTLNKFYR